MIRVYLDTSVYNRPFDDQTQKKIPLETEAVLGILGMIENKEIELVNSSILDYENSRNPKFNQKQNMIVFQQMANIRQAKTKEVEKRANELENQGIKTFDALHVASAESANCDYFITCDRRLINRCQTLSTLKTVNPINFIAEVQNDS